MSIILSIVGIITLLIGLYLSLHTKKINDKIIIQNIEIDRQNAELKKVSKNLRNDIYIQQEKSKELHQHFIDQTEFFEKRCASMEKTQREMSQRAFENYCEILEKNYQEREEEYKLLENNLETSYSNKQIELERELEEIQQELEKIRATRAAAIEAKRKEQEIKERLSFYCLKIPQNNLDDITVLNKVKSQLYNSRILSMLIWQTYFQKPMNTLCNNVLGTKTICGIYKITNQLNDSCYIGQSVDMATRWKSHAKCGLGIDTPPGNKLYAAMQEYGLHNFSFELLEECPREQLNEKERFYIDLYQADKFGYNILKGNN